MGSINARLEDTCQIKQINMEKLNLFNQKKTKKKNVSTTPHKFIKLKPRPFKIAK